MAWKSAGEVPKATQKPSENPKKKVQKWTHFGTGFKPVLVQFWSQNGVPDASWEGHI